MSLQTLGASAALSLAAACNPAASTTASTSERGADCSIDPAAIEFETSPGGTPEVTPRSVRSQACALRIVDVREERELQGGAGVIPGAQLVPMRRLATEAVAWDRHQPIVLACRSGRRSGTAAVELQRMGFTRVASMTGGMLRWRELGLPTADPATASASATVGEPPVRQPLSRQAIVDHVADKTQVRWTKAATLMLQGTQACVDGRDAHAIVGTPGGDAGELILALATAEQLTAKAFTTAEVEHIFDDYLEAFGRFYLHSDEHAVAILLEELAHRQPDASLPEAHDPRAVEFLRAPPPALRDALAALVAEPAHVGCGHLRLMLLHAADYGVREALVADVIRAFFRRLWQGDRELEFVVLQGGHHESAVMTVELSKDVRAYTRIPLVSPRVADTELFVAHPQVARFVRRNNAAFLLEEVPLLAATHVREAQFFAALDRLATAQQDLTIGHLAAGLPHFRVRFDGDDFEVEKGQHP